MPGNRFWSPPILTYTQGQTKKELVILEIGLYHGSITKKGSTCTERVGENVDRPHCTGLKIPKSSPGRVAVDLERVVTGT